MGENCCFLLNYGAEVRSREAISHTSVVDITKPGFKYYVTVGNNDSVKSLLLD